MSKQIAIDDIDTLTMTIADKAIDAAATANADDDLGLDSMEALEIAADEAASTFGVDADEMVAAMKYHLRRRTQ